MPFTNGISSLIQNNLARGSVLTSALLLVGLFLFNIRCSNPVNHEQIQVPWDTTFSIAGIQFPNDTLYQRALISQGSNFRTHQFLNKCKTQDTVRIGFIGGSITAGASASSLNLRFSSRFCESIRSCFPNLKQVLELNAGIGATSSRFACSRVKDDLFNQKPDIIIIDYAVNDWILSDSLFICSSIEGLIRQCLAFNPDVPVILLYFALGNGLNVQHFQSQIGSYYSLPIISYRDAVWPLIQNGTTPWDAFFQNDPHPNDNGHLVAAYLLYTYLKNEMKENSGPKVPIPSPKVSDLYQYSTMWTKNDTVLQVMSSNWQIKNREYERYYLESAQSGDSIVINSACQEISLGLHMQTSVTSAIRISVDNGLLDTTLTNNYLYEYIKFIRLYITTVNQSHTVRIYHLDNNQFMIDYLIYAYK
jgi:hypothetical protein